MLARLSILFVQGEAVRHRVKLANPAASQLLAGGQPTLGGPGRTIRWLGANNPSPGLRKTRHKTNSL